MSALCYIWRGIPLPRYTGNTPHTLSKQKSFSIIIPSSFNESNLPEGELPGRVWIPVELAVVDAADPLPEAPLGGPVGVSHGQQREHQQRAGQPHGELVRGQEMSEDLKCWVKSDKNEDCRWYDTTVFDTNIKCDRLSRREELVLTLPSSIIVWSN